MIRRLHPRRYVENRALGQALLVPCTSTAARPAARSSGVSRATHPHGRREASALRAAAVDTDSASPAALEGALFSTDGKVISDIHAVSSLAMLVQLADNIKHQSGLTARVSGSIAVQALRLLIEGSPGGSDASQLALQQSIKETAAAEQARLEAASAAADAASAAAQQAAAAAAALLAAARQAAQAAEAAAAASSALRDATMAATTIAATVATASELIAAATKAAELAAAMTSTADQATAQLSALPDPSRGLDATESSTTGGDRDLAAVRAVLQDCLAKLTSGGWSAPSAPSSRQSDGASPSGSRDLHITAALLALAEVQSRRPGAVDRLQLHPSIKAALMQGVAPQTWADLLEGVTSGQQQRRQMATNLLQRLRTEGRGAGEGADMVEVAVLFAASGQQQLTVTPTTEQAPSSSSAAPSQGPSTPTEVSPAFPQSTSSSPSLQALRAQLAACRTLQQLEQSPALREALDSETDQGVVNESVWAVVQRITEITGLPQGPRDASTPLSEFPFLRSACMRVPLAALVQVLQPALVSLQPQHSQALMTALASSPTPLLLRQLNPGGQQGQGAGSGLRTGAEQNADAAQPLLDVRSSAPEAQEPKPLQQLSSLLNGTSQRLSGLLGGLMPRDPDKEQQQPRGGAMQMDATSDGSASQGAASTKQFLGDLVASGAGKALQAITNPMVEPFAESYIRLAFAPRLKPPADAKTAQQIRSTTEPSLQQEQAYFLVNYEVAADMTVGFMAVGRFRREHSVDQWQQLLSRSAPKCPIWLRNPTRDREALCSRTATLSGLADAAMLAAEVHAEQQAYDVQLLDLLMVWDQDRAVRSSNLEAVSQFLKAAADGRVAAPAFTAANSEHMVETAQKLLQTAEKESSWLKRQLVLREVYLRPSHLIPNRASFVLNEALKRHLHSAAQDAAHVGAPPSQRSGRGQVAYQYVLDNLPSWLVKLQFWPSWATCKLLLSTVPSSALLTAVPSPQAGTDAGVAVLRFVTTVAATALMDPDSSHMSPDDTSRWLRQALRCDNSGVPELLLLADKLAADRDDGNGKAAFDPFTDSLHINIADLDELESPMMSDDTDQRLACLLTTVDPSSGDLAAVVEVCLIRVQGHLDNGQEESGRRATEMLAQVVDSLQRVKPSEQPTLLRRSLELAGWWLPASPETFLQIVRRVPDDVVLIGTKAGWGASGSVLKPVTARGTTSVRSLTDAISDAAGQQLASHAASQATDQPAKGPASAEPNDAVAPLQVAASLVQLPLARGGILLPLYNYEVVVKAALQCGQDSLALQVLATLFSAGDRALLPSGSSTLSRSLLGSIVQHTSPLSTDPARLSLSSLLEAAAPLGPQHRTLLLRGLLTASAAARSSTWAYTVAMEAPTDCFTPDVVSDLVTAFVLPAVRGTAGGQGRPAQQLQQSPDKGVAAAVKAVQMLTQSASGGLPKTISAMSQLAREGMATWLVQQGSVAGEGPAAASATTKTAASTLPMILALCMKPSPAMARQLLEHHAASLSADDLRLIVSLAEERQWAGLGRAILACLRNLPHLQQEVLGKGTASTLACLLAGDAGAESKSGSEQSSSLKLLLAFLQESVVGGAEGSGQAVPEGASRFPFSRPEWRQLLASLLDVSDATGSREAADAAASIASMAHAAALLGPDPDGGRAEQQPQFDATPLARTSWLVQECLLVRGALRQPVSLALAQHLLQDLRSQGWGLTPQAEMASLAGSNERLDEVDQSVQQSVTQGVDLLVWMGSSPAIRGGVTASLALPVTTPPTAQSLHWLPELVSDLCSHLAAVDNDWVRRPAGDTQGVVFLGNACADHDALLPLVQLMVAVVVSKGVISKVPTELVAKAVEAAADLTLWRQGSILLGHLGLDLQSWRSQQGAARCREIIRILTPAQVQAALTILIQDAPSYVLSNNARALTAVCSFCEDRLRTTAPGDHSMLLGLLLSGRRAAAAAASEPSTEHSCKADSSVPQELDPAWHCQEAERVARQMAPAMDTDTLLQLLSVFEAAQRPVYAVRLGLEVASGVLAVAPSLSGSDGMSVVTSSMGISNQGGYYEGAVLLLEELLTARGEVDDTEVMAQALAAVGLAGETKGDELAQRIVAAVGDDGYFTMEGGASSSGSDSSCEDVDGGSSRGVVVRADPSWLEGRRALDAQQRQKEWGLLLQRQVAAKLSMPEQLPVSQPSWTPVVSISTAQPPARAPLEPETNGPRRIVALFGGKDFRAADRQLLEDKYCNDDVEWYGDSEHVGQGNRSEDGLIRKVKRRRVRLVLLLANGTSPSAATKVKDACRGHGVKWQMIPGSLKANVHILT